MKDIIKKEFEDYDGLRKCYDNLFKLLQEKTLMVSPGSIKTEGGSSPNSYRSYRMASFLVPLSNPATIYLISEEIHSHYVSVTLEDKLIKNDEDKKTIEEICNLIKEIVK
ncbi:MAG: hypothetical protein V1660_03180 [archaeon]